MIVCKECGQENLEGLEYCDGCGARLDAAPTGETASAPEAATPSPEMRAAQETPTPEATPIAEGETAPSPRTFKITIIRGGTLGKEFILQEGDNLVGRWDPDSGAFPEVDLEADDPEARVSRKHALIRVGEQVTLEDIGSLNGTFVNRGPRLEPGAPVSLKDGDEIIIGKTFLKVAIP
jgi:hypothetical protein